jgi:hypothetical protein
MRKLFFALSLVGMLMTQTLSYATTFLNPTAQETEQQEEAVTEETVEQETPVMEETAAMEEKIYRRRSWVYGDRFDLFDSWTRDCHRANYLP